jgi:hypothetical protein
MKYVSLASVNRRISHSPTPPDDYIISKNFSLLVQIKYVSLASVNRRATHPTLLEGSAIQIILLSNEIEKLLYPNSSLRLHQRFGSANLEIINAKQNISCKLNQKNSYMLYKHMKNSLLHESFLKTNWSFLTVRKKTLLTAHLRKILCKIGQNPICSGATNT